MFDNNAGEHLQEMRESYESQVGYLRATLILKGQIEGDEDDLEDVVSLLREHDEDDDLGNWAISTQFTINPIWGGDNRDAAPRAASDEYFIVVQFAYGGPTYALRALIDAATEDILSLHYVYQHWSVGYEMAVPERDAEAWNWYLQNYVLDLLSQDEIYEKLMDDGARVCDECHQWFYSSDDESLCNNCRDQEK